MDLVQEHHKESCCEMLFEKYNPIFVHQAGTCYHTKRDDRIWESVPSSSSAITLFLWKMETMMQNVLFSGVLAGDQSNLKWAFSDKDAPGNLDHFRYL